MSTTSLQLPSMKSGGEQMEMERLLQHYLGELPLNGPDSFSSRPVMMTSGYTDQMKELARVLHLALRAVVMQYFRDQRIREIYDLDEDLESILHRTDSRPYHIGLYRPDFLYDLSGQPKICEVGARYPLNGWMLSYFLNRISTDMQLSAGSGGGGGTLRPVPDQLDFPDRLFRRFDMHLPVTLLHDQEKGTEVFYLLDMFRRRGMDWMQARPQDLEYTDGEVHYHGKVLSQFIFEMDREELKKFHPEVLDHIIRNGNYFNDVRTLILVHDKRVLAVLYNRQIMEDYLVEEDHALLRSYLIPTFGLHTLANREAIIVSPRNWILKRNSGGRGIDAHIKSECTEEEWKHLLRTGYRNYMAQHYVDQLPFAYSQEHTAHPIHLVGMLLCYNDQSCGPGLFRGSAEHVINVHQGRAMIFPAMVQNPKL